MQSQIPIPFLLCALHTKCYEMKYKKLSFFLNEQGQKNTQSTNQTNQNLIMKFQ